MQRRFARFSIGMMGLLALIVASACAEGEEIDAKGASSGRAGAGGAAGSNGTEAGGAGGAGTAGSGDTGGSGGSGAFGGSGGSGGAVDAGSGKGGSGGVAGRGGSGGSAAGSGGATGGSGGSTGGSGGTTAGSGGSKGGSGGATGGSGGLGGTGGVAGAGGATDAGSGVDGGVGSCPATATYCDDFERDLAGAMPAGWTRVGGSDGDWEVSLDMSNVFAQNHASSSTFRLCYSSGATGAPWTGAMTVSTRVKILALGSSGISTALVCLGYRTSGANYACLALEQGSGARIRMNAGGSSTDGPLWPTAIALGTWYDVKISADQAGALSAYLGGVLLGSYMPPSAITSGYVAVATQSSQAAFDVVMVTQP